MFTHPFIKLCIVAGFLIICGMFYAKDLNSTITYDEAATYFDSRNSNPAQILISYHTPNNHLLSTLTIWCSIQVLGLSELAIRLPTFFSALLGLSLSYTLAKKLHSHESGLLAISLMAVHPTFMTYAIWGRGYMLAICLMLVMILLAQHKESSRFNNYTLVLVNALLILTLPTMILASGAVILWLLYERRWATIAPIIVGTVVGLIFYLPSLWLGSITQNATHFGLSPERLVEEVFQVLIKTLVMIPILIGLGLYLGFKHRPLLLLLFAMIISAIAGPLFLFLLGANAPYARNFLYLIPFFAIMGAIGWGKILNPTGLGLASAVLLFAFLLIKPPQLPPQDGTTQALAYVESADEDAAIFIDCCFQLPVLFYRHHDRRLFIDPNETQVTILQYRDTPENILIAYAAQDFVDACEYREQYASFRIYTCPITP